MPSGFARLSNRILMDGHHKPPLALLLLSPVRKQMMPRGAEAHRIKQVSRAWLSFMQKEGKMTREGIGFSHPSVRGSQCKQVFFG